MKQSDRRNQVKRKLLSCSRLLTVVKLHFAVATRFIAAKGYAHLGEAVRHCEGKAWP